MMVIIGILFIATIAYISFAVKRVLNEMLSEDSETQI